MKRDRHVPHLCPTCDGPLTAADYCTRCSKEIAAEELPVAKRDPANGKDRKHANGPASAGGSEGGKGSESEDAKEPAVERLMGKLPGKLGERVRDRFGSDS